MQDLKKYLLEDLFEMRLTAYSTACQFNDEKDNLLNAFSSAVQMLYVALNENKKILVCGNGGSASDVEHMAGEIVGRFGFDRPSLPCVSLCGPTATFTAIANDYGYENVFARQVQGFGQSGDVLIGLSTSGNSKNIVKAFEEAKKNNIKTIAMTGAKESLLSKLADICIRVPSVFTPRIQEIHGIIIHSMCRAIELMTFKDHPEKPVLPYNKLIKGKKELAELANAIKPYKSVFTNGCFDILHPGHVYILQECRKQGDLLIVGLNSDDSIKRLKGASRPYHKFSDRANVLSALECVDYVIEFSDDTPLKLIETLTPKVLIKGGDYTIETVVGADHVIKNGGEVKIIPLLEGHSTTAILANGNMKGER